MKTKGPFSDIPLATFFDEYVKERRYCSQLSDETIRGYEAVFELFLKIMPEVLSIDFLTKEILTEFF
jgi:hypothetical protein